MMTQEEQKRLQAELLPGERVLWHGRPQLPVVNSATLPLFLLALLCPLLLLFPVLQQRRLRRTLYLLTDRRILVYRANWWRGVNRHAWPLEPGIITARVHRPGGRGDLIMEYTYGRCVSEDKGFLNVPDAMRIARLVDAAEKRLNCI
ncbi:MAG: hypothetical protein IJX33_06440 [Akkermansia sp.]|nr:hypothetical protein [Akkermansia sp.]